MSKLTWDAIGEHYYETGVSQVALYVHDPEGNGAGVSGGNGTGYADGVAWNGITGLTVSPSGAEANALYADDIKYLNLLSAEEVGATIEAYTYPDAFGACDGSAALAPGAFVGQQKRKTFCVAFKTRVGNDEDGSDHAYKLHILYQCLASPSERAYATINESPEAITFSWEVSTTPIEVTGFKPTAYVCIDSRTADPDKLAILEGKLFGVNASTDPVVAEVKPHIVFPDEIADDLAEG